MSDKKSRGHGLEKNADSIQETMLQMLKESVFFVNEPSKSGSYAGAICKRLKILSVLCAIRKSNSNHNKI